MTPTTPEAHEVADLLHELWVEALAVSHADGAHGDDPSGYWRCAGCEACAAAH